MKLASDRYKAIYASAYSERPSADAMPDEAIHISTDEAHLGILSIKPGKGQGWIEVTARNADFLDWLDSTAFALAGHKHPLSDITGIIAKGYIFAFFGTGNAVPIGEKIYFERLGDLAIEGTKVEIYLLEAFVEDPPAAPITFVVKINDTSIGSITIPTGNTYGKNDLETPVEPEDGDFLQIDGPADEQGARGGGVKIYLRRVSTG